MKCGYSASSFQLLRACGLAHPCNSADKFALFGVPIDVFLCTHGAKLGHVMLLLKDAHKVPYSLRIVCIRPGPGAGRYTLGIVVRPVYHAQVFDAVRITIEKFSPGTMRKAQALFKTVTGPCSHPAAPLIAQERPPVVLIQQFRVAGSVLWVIVQHASLGVYLPLLRVYNAVLYGVLRHHAIDRIKLVLGLGVIDLLPRPLAWSFAGNILLFRQSAETATAHISHAARHRISCHRLNTPQL